MTGLALLVLGSTLMAADGGEATPPDDQAAVDAPEQPKQGSWEGRRIKQRRAAANAIIGSTLEVGSVLLHVLNGGIFIGRDLGLSSEGCNASDNPCGGPPFFIVVPLGATTMGWIGAARLAEAREANLRDSWMYWVGTGVEIGAYLVTAPGWGAKGKNARLAWDTTFVSMAALGTVLQVVGALTGPTRADVDAVASRSPHVIPGCAPILGGMTCGIAVAGF